MRDYTSKDFIKYLKRKHRREDISGVYIKPEQLSYFYLNYNNKCNYGKKKAFFSYCDDLDLNYNTLYKKDNSTWYTKKELGKKCFDFDSSSFVDVEDMVFNIITENNTILVKIRKSYDIKMKPNNGNIKIFSNDWFYFIRISYNGKQEREQYLELFYFYKWILTGKVDKMYGNSFLLRNKEDLLKLFFNSEYLFSKMIDINSDKILEIKNFNFLPKGKKQFIIRLNKTFINLKDYNYLNKDEIIIKRLKPLERYLKKHSSVRVVNNFLINNGLCLFDIFDILEWIKVQESFVIGIYETSIVNFKAIASLNITKAHVLNYLNKEMVHVQSQENKELVNPLLIKDKRFSYITELYTKLLLKKEGLYMKHCVGGYSKRLVIDKGNSRIFHIDLKESSCDRGATLYIKKMKTMKKGVLKYSLQQLKGYKNSQVSDKYKTYVDEFIRELNKK